MAKATKEEVTRTVTRTYLGQTTENVDTMEIRPFATETAHVAVKKGCPVPMGGRNSAWIGVEISAPCYHEEIPAVFEQVSALVDKCLEYELDKLKGVGGDAEK